MGTVGRLFLGVDLSPEARQALVAQLMRPGPFDLPGRSVPPENWHLTLRFLGDVDPVSCDKLLLRMSDSDLGRRFGITFGNLGAFPRPGRATVLWTGIDEGADSLSMLAETVDDAVTQAGLALDDRPFRPHLTLSRIRPTQDVSELIEAFGGLGVRTWVTDVTLFRSHLGDRGARYEVLERFALDR